MLAGFFNFLMATDFLAEKVDTGQHVSFKR